ncbi:uncharacterized protein DEA37_0012097 [Paragonimus westermani]|uniref:Uncharacterized protein n=1 Tax=Paragonimus westermani TaxID=34504 RepID=A0A5J4NBG8_9TREM|nr:uncharacterized protein DEA37_0012097 [Paragonimus westermani]
MVRAPVVDDNINSDETYRIWESACLFTKEKLQSEKVLTLLRMVSSILLPGSSIWKYWMLPLSAL